ncbi:Conjugative transposon protein TraO [Chryseobacterium sp. MOF25P]|uniref:conjugal transfer protein TraO n=1 Tax=unclassified Chryseobacterium TaxID=2593645 RepID=UPI000804CCA5|nr:MULTISPECIES: conjugal transfer protein TraO [unclassified Chryseobacterium]OBW41810.1 Conjugative transposon protein TraO [Chryseobacterium sp. MOF25P]OBW44650.1 Conjugative transposon protein TraO [Chryseobacterium sp. BGARF1]
MFCLISSLVNAQRMIPKQKAFEINVGTFAETQMNRNFYLNAGFVVYGKKGNYQLYGLEYSRQTVNYKSLSIPVENYLSEVGYGFHLIGDYKRNINLYTSISATAGYESINNGNSELPDGGLIIDQDNFIYGAGGRLSLETYVTDHLVLLIQGKVKVLWSTDLEQFRPSVGFGFRFNF